MMCCALSLCKHAEHALFIPYEVDMLTRRLSTSLQIAKFNSHPSETYSETVFFCYLALQLQRKENVDR